MDLRRIGRSGWVLAAALVATALTGCLPLARDFSVIRPEERSVQIRRPERITPAPMAAVPPPNTVSTPAPPLGDWHLTLDEAVQIALQNTKVVRVLAGLTAGSSGRTIYDAAVTSTAIDVQRSRFDPVLGVANTWTRSEPPTAIFDPSSPLGVRITGTRTDSYNLNASLSNQLPGGGLATLTITDTFARFRPGVFPLNPQSPNTIDLTFRQPLLRGAGRPANIAPIVIAQINTERSFFAFKDALQEQVRGVIEAYWALVAADIDVEAKKKQVEQAEFAYQFSASRLKAGLKGVSQASVALAKVTLANFRANLVSARANRIQREDALRNIMGLPPADGRRIVPVTKMDPDRHVFDWDEIVRIAEVHRPDLVDLRLTLESDRQALIQARNLALPQVDLVGQYRWNGLDGRTPNGTPLSSRGGEFTDWTLALDVSLPLGLRRDRAILRQLELAYVRDQANLDQGLHNAIHQLATSIRNLDQYYEQYRAFKEAVAAAKKNVIEQEKKLKTGIVDALNLRQAIADLGNAISAEAQALALYNTELANLERLTGTILQTHGVYFYEERFPSIGPLGRLKRPVLYSSALPPVRSPNRSDATGAAGERDTVPEILPQPRERPAIAPDSGRAHLGPPMP